MEVAYIVDRLLMVITTHLGLIERLLVDVLVGLAAIKPRLPVVKRPGRRLVLGIVPAALVVEVTLVAFHACLIAVAEQLRAVTENLLEVGEALLLRQFACRIRRVICCAHLILASSEI